jgi:ribonuclease J
MQLTIYRGTHEIGGNCVELRTDSTRIIVDVGMPLIDANGESFDAQSLGGKSVLELLEDKTIPRVPGLFQDPTDSVPAPAAILLSHAHCDHTGLLKYTRQEIPVWLSPGTSDMMYVGLKFAGQVGVSSKRQRRFTPCQPFSIGDFTITAYPVDHSAFDSMAFLIEAEGKRILYSGDLRLHGRKPGMIEGLLEAASKGPIHVLIMEGTNVIPSGKPQKTEWDLEKELIGHIQQSKGIVLANFSPLHVDRLVGFFKAAANTGRTFVADPYAALVMNKASQYCGVPDPARDRRIKVFFHRSFEEAYERKGLSYVRNLFWENRIPLDSIRENPNQFVMVFRPSMVAQDFGGTLPPSASFIYSYWTGYLEQPHWAQFRDLLTQSGGQFISAHTSGHIGADDLRKFIDRMNSQRVIPIHTLTPEAFQDDLERVVRLEDGQPYQVS